MSAVQAVCEEKFILRTSDFDRWGRLQPSSILELFQDAAGIHAARLDAGAAQMQQRQLLWVLTKVRFRVLGAARMFQEVTVRTWPLPPGRLGFQREYQILDAEGRELVRGSSQWVLIHSEKRCFMPAKDVYPPELVYCTETMFEEKMLRLRDFEPQGEPLCLRPGFSQLDINGHVNNSRYAAFVLDVLVPGENESIASFQLDYHREVQPGMQLQIFTRREENCFLACGRSPEGDNMFACRMELA